MSLRRAIPLRRVGVACWAATSRLKTSPGARPGLDAARGGGRIFDRSPLNADYGARTGHAVVPVVVQAMRPWITGLIGVCARTYSVTTSSMVSCTV